MSHKQEAAAASLATGGGVSASAGRSPQVMAAILLALASLLLLLQLQLQLAAASPVVSGYLNPWQVPFRHSAGMLREPMPWEDGYFDPSYHAWPKSRQQQVGDKQSVRLASDQTVFGGGSGGGSVGGATDKVAASGGA